LNPSNTGIAIVLILFPWIGIAPPYQFTENISGVADWVLPVIFIMAGSFLNAKFTKRMPLILAWFGGFILQAILRSSIFQTPVLAPLNVMSGVAFLLFSFYMISDPATSPSKTKNQIFFGSSVAIVYGLLVTFEIVFGLFFSLLIVCSLRGVYLWFLSFSVNPMPEKTKEFQIYLLEPEQISDFNVTKIKSYE
jgi:Na+-translocating ferredoxin:NAD+ oxidoreductase RnfD subunit